MNEENARLGGNTRAYPAWEPCSQPSEVLSGTAIPSLTPINLGEGNVVPEYLVWMLVRRTFISLVWNQQGHYGLLDVFIFWHSQAQRSARHTLISPHLIPRFLFGDGVVPNIPGWTYILISCLSLPGSWDSRHLSPHWAIIYDNINYLYFKRSVRVFRRKLVWSILESYYLSSVASTLLQAEETILWSSVIL